MQTSTPFALGVKSGAFLRSLVSVDNRGLIIAHRLKGRRRYQCLALKGQSALCAKVEKFLAAQEFIKSAAVNPVTGSITVTYQANEVIVDSLFDALSHELSGRHAIQEPSLIPSALITASNNLNDAASRLIDGFKDFLNHTEPMFLSRIAGVLLIACGLNRVLLQGERPSGPQLFWWGLGLLVHQTHKHLATLKEN